MNQQATSSMPRRASSPSLWRNRNFLLLWSGQASSALGTSVSSTVFPLLVLALTDSPAAAGLASSFYLLPYMLFSLPIGALIDRWDRKQVMIVCDTVRLLSLASVPLALGFDVLTVTQLYVCAAVEGSMFVFVNLAEVSALAYVVGKEQLPAAFGRQELSSNLIHFLGPSLGGMLYQYAGRGIPFVFDSLSYLLGIVSLLLIKAPFQTERSRARRHLLKEIHEGLDWLWRHHLLRFMALLTSAMNLTAPAITLLVIVRARSLGMGEAATGLVFSIAAIGAIAGSAMAIWVQKRFRFGRIIVGSVCCYLLIFPLFAFANTAVLLSLVTALAYTVVPVYNLSQASYRLALIPDALQGRVNSCYRQLLFGVQPIGALLAGSMLERLGVAYTAGCFAVWIAVWALCALAYRSLRTA